MSVDFARLKTEDFVFESTLDGSPTLRLQGPEGLSEAMHSLKGAFSETEYIYGTAILRSLENTEQAPRVLSMGLGLGYIEVLATALALKAGRAQELSGESFEAVPQLREWFLAWVQGNSAQPSASTLPLGFQQAYDQLLQKTAAATATSASDVHRELRRAFVEGRWVFSGPLTPETEFQKPYTCICFDAFSSKSAPDLWNESFLLDFLARATTPSCVFSTYACTGSLKRALRTSGFQLNIREGFASKRDSTFAER